MTKEKLLKDKEEIAKAIEQKVGELNFLHGQKAYNELLLKELEDAEKEEIKPEN